MVQQHRCDDSERKDDRFGSEETPNFANASSQSQTSHTQSSRKNKNKIGDASN
eukprot:jgi/Psemu1/310124/fgenesh1_kg.595_\